MNESRAAMDILIESWWECRIVLNPNINRPLFLGSGLRFFVAVAVTAGSGWRTTSETCHPTAGEKINIHFIDLCIMISACKIKSPTLSIRS